MRVQGRKKERRERGRVPEAGVCKKLEEEKRLMKRDEEEERRRAVRDEGEKNKEHEKGEEKVKVEE